MFEHVFVLLDVSQSMRAPAHSPPPGLTRLDVAALCAAQAWQSLASTTVVPFAHDVFDIALGAREDVAANARKLSELSGSPTNPGAALAFLNLRLARGNLVLYLSDSLSWLDPLHGSSPRGVAARHQWESFKRRNPGAQLVCVDPSQPTRGFPETFVA